MSSIGIMDPAFFVGKAVLLKWLNDLLELNYTKVEQCCTGAAHCQILDIIWPGKVPLSKVNFDAKFDYEWVANFKILQGVFTKMEVPKHVDVEKLVKGKYQDNLEFLQWMKNFFETKYTGQEYHAKERRDTAGTAYRKGRSAAPSGVARPKAEGGVRAPAAGGEEKKGARAPAGNASPPAGGGAVAKRAPAKAPAAAAPGKRAAGAAPKVAAKKEVASEADSEALATLQATIEGLEKERNFYFGKLREIEILCQTDESVEAATKKQVLQILYHTDDDNEFQSPQDAAAEEEAAATSAKPAKRAGGKARNDDDEELVTDEDLLANGGEALSF